MRDIRSVFNGILRRYGHDILLQRRINDYNAQAPEYSDTLERWTTRHSIPGSGILSSLANESIEGITHGAGMVYYFQWDTNPREGDRIYENLDLYPNDLNIWTIDWAEPKRGKGGRVEFWTCGATREEPS